MFNHPVSQLPLTNVYGASVTLDRHLDSFKEDESFINTLRVLIHNKISIGESLSVVLSNSIAINGAIALDNSCSIPGITNRVEGSLYIVEIVGCNEENLQRDLESSIRDSRFKFVKDISFYLSQGGFTSCVYLNESSKETVLLTTRVDLRYWHYMQSAITRLLPWYFKKPLTELETELLSSLTLKTPSKYIELIDRISRKLDFRKEIILTSLKDFGMISYKNQIDAITKDIQTNLAEFEMLQQRIADIISKNSEYEIRRNGLLSAIEQGSTNGLSDYFICHRHLHIVSTGCDWVDYVVTTHLEYFDQNVFEKCLNNPKSYLYNYTRSVETNNKTLTTEMLRELLVALFGDEQKIKVRVVAKFKLTANSSITISLCADNEKRYLEDCLPHPHINNVRCLGTNATHINELMLARDYIGAVEQTVSAVKNINFADSIVGNNFIKVLVCTNNRCIELENGETLTPREAVAWLKGEECIKSEKKKRKKKTRK